MKKKQRRIILRIEVSPEVPHKIGDTIERVLSTHVSVTSRLMSWFVEQDYDLQATILKLMSEGLGIDVTRRVLEGIRRSSKNSGKSGGARE